MATVSRKSSSPVRTLSLGDKGSDVAALQKKLLERGFNPGVVDGIFGNGTEAAVMAFQRSESLLADGIVGERTHGVLFQGKPGELKDVTPLLGPIEVARMFPHTPLANIKNNLPHVHTAMRAARLHDRLMVLMALATIRAETESFQPVEEAISLYNTSPTGHPFDLYDNRKDLGNKGKGDGERYRGRGYVQLIGRDNYLRYGNRLGKPLLERPELACESGIAAALLALFLGDREKRIKEALLDWDFAGARRLVSGGSHGLDRFIDAYKVGIQLTA